jgi:propionyl-CoA synthetase
VKTFFTSPTAFRGLKREDPDGNYVKKYDLSSLKSLWLAGERADPDTVVWAEKARTISLTRTLRLTSYHKHT